MSVELFAPKELSPANYLPPDRCVHDYSGQVEEFGRDSAVYADVMDAVAKATYDDYLAGEAAFADKLFANATRPVAARLSVTDQSLVPYETYLSEKTAFVNRNQKPYTTTVDEYGTLTDKTLDYGDLERFANGYARPTFAPLVWSDPYKGDKLEHAPVSANRLQVFLATLWSCDQWPGMVSEWLGRHLSNLRARAHIGRIALAD